MAAQPNANPPGGDTTKIVVLVVLVAVFAGIWVPRLLKKSRRPQAASAAAPTSSTATAAPTLEAATTAKPAAPAAPTPSPATCAVATACSDADGPPAELKRDPFTVSEALRQLMTVAQPATPTTQSAPEAAASQAPDLLREARLWTLQATVIDGAARYGMIDGRIAVEGQTFKGLTVKSVGEREVVLEGPTGELRLTMDEGEAK